MDRCYADLEAAVADRHDAAVVATPAHLHIPMATRLAEAGVPMLIEKPVSTSVEGIDQLRQLLRSRGLVAAVGYDLRAHPLLQEMKKAIASGRFGQPVQFIAACGQHFPTYRPAYREIYYRDRATGGGAIQDALTHILDAMEGRASPLCSLEDGIRTLHTNLAVLTSVDRGTWQPAGSVPVPGRRSDCPMSEAEKGLSKDAIPIRS